MFLTFPNSYDKIFTERKKGKVSEKVSGFMIGYK